MMRISCILVFKIQKHFLVFIYNKSLTYDRLMGLNIFECYTFETRCVLNLQPLADAYGLLMHKNGQWEWTLAPGISPSPRYQHAAVIYIYLIGV